MLHIFYWRTKTKWLWNVCCTNFLVENLLSWNENLKKEVTKLLNDREKSEKLLTFLGSLEQGPGSGLVIPLWLPCCCCWGMISWYELYSSDMDPSVTSSALIGPHTLWLPCSVVSGSYQVEFQNWHRPSSATYSPSPRNETKFWFEYNLRLMKKSARKWR